MWSFIRPRTGTLRFWQALVLVVIFVFWWAMTTPGVIPPLMFENDRQAAFFFGEPIKIFARIWEWFVTDRDIYGHLWVTLLETVLAFLLGTVAGLVIGMWLALSPVASARLFFRRTAVRRAAFSDADLEVMAAALAQSGAARCMIDWYRAAFRFRAARSARTIEAPTLLVVGGHDYGVIELNEAALAELRCEKELAVVPGATHLFEESGTLEEGARLAAAWFVRHLTPAA